MYFPTITAGSDLHGLCAILSRLILTQECNCMNLVRHPPFGVSRVFFVPPDYPVILTLDKERTQAFHLHARMPREPPGLSRVSWVEHAYTPFGIDLYLVAPASVLNRTIRRSSKHACRVHPTSTSASTYCIPISRA